MTMMEEGANAQAANGFFNAMLGSGDAVAVPGGGGGGFPAAFDLEGDLVVRCYCMFGRKVLKCEDTSVDLDSDGIVVAVVDHSNGSSPVLSVKRRSGGPEDAVNNASVSERPLYLIKDGMVEADLRTAPTVTAWLP